MPLPLLRMIAAVLVAAHLIGGALPAGALWCIAPTCGTFQHISAAAHEADDCCGSCGKPVIMEHPAELTHSHLDRAECECCIPVPAQDRKACLDAADSTRSLERVLSVGWVVAGALERTSAAEARLARYGLPPPDAPGFGHSAGLQNIRLLV